MQATLTLPSGRKVRTASQRRYVLVADQDGFNPVILRRSDNLDRLRSIARKFPHSGVIFDTTTKQVVR